MKSKSKITIVLTSLYVILWLPEMVMTVHPDKKDFVVADHIFYHLVLLNSSVNAFVYSLITEKYKKSFKFILTNRPCEWKNLPRVLAKQKWSQTFTSQTTSSRENSRRTPSSRQSTHSHRSIVSMSILSVSVSLCTRSRSKSFV